ELFEKIDTSWNELFIFLADAPQLLPKNRYNLSTGIIPFYHYTLGEYDSLRKSRSFTRICKLHRQEVDTSSSSTILHSYGTHMVTSMSLGFLFLEEETLHFQPHLQAFRHLWVLAVEPRCLVLRDIETREACHIPVKLVFKNYYNGVKIMRDDGREEILVDSKSKVIVGPCLLPESGFIQTIEIDSPRY
ncbi:15565_t:CDS:2, partial [Cetraspora pellucida]